MPFKNIESMPIYTKKYSITIRRQMLHVFNSTFKKVMKETKEIKEAEQRAFMAMHSVLKKRFKAKDSMSKNSQHDHMNVMVDNFLGNLQG